MTSIACNSRRDDGDCWRKTGDGDLQRGLPARPTSDKTTDLRAPGPVRPGPVRSGPVRSGPVRSGPVQVSSLVVSIDCRTKGGRPRRPYSSTTLRSAVSPRDTVTRSPATTRRKLRIRRLMIAFCTKSVGAFFAELIKTIALLRFRTIDAICEDAKVDE